MPALNFPNSPTLGQQYTSGTAIWVWNGVSWDKIAETGPQGIQGIQGIQGPQGSSGMPTDDQIIALSLLFG